MLSSADSDNSTKLDHCLQALSLSVKRLELQPAALGVDVIAIATLDTAETVFFFHLPVLLGQLYRAFGVRNGPLCPPDCGAFGHCPSDLMVSPPLYPNETLGFLHAYIREAFTNK